MRTLLLLVLLAAAASASAQPMWRPALGRPNVSLEVLRPFQLDGLRPFQERFIVTDERGNIIGDVGPGGLNSAQIVTAHVPVNSAFTLVADLPTAYFDYTATPEGGSVLDPTSEFGVGNPYLGVEASVGRDWTVEVGGRAPLASFSGPAETGGQAFPVRAEAFRAEVASAVLGVRFERSLTRDLAVRLRAAPTVLYSARDFEGSEFDHVALIGSFGAHALGRFGRVEVGAGVAGQEAVALQVGQFGRVRATVVEAGGAVEVGPVRPGVTLRYTVRGDYPSDAVVGLSLNVRL